MGGLLLRKKEDCFINLYLNSTKVLARYIRPMQLIGHWDHIPHFDDFEITSGN